MLGHDSKYARERRSRDRHVYESVGDHFPREDDTPGVRRIVDGATKTGNLLDTIRSVLRGSYHVLFWERMVTYLWLSGSTAFSKKQLELFDIVSHSTNENVELPTSKRVRGRQ